MATPGPKRDGGSSSKELGGGRVGHSPSSQDSWWLESPIQSPPSPGLSAADPKNSRMLPRPAFHLHPSALLPSPPHALSHPFHHCFSGSKWFPPWPHPTRVGRGTGPGPDHPHRSCPKATMFLLSRCVSPASSLPLLSAARSSLSPCAPAALTRLQLTFLGLSPPPPPICSSQGSPWASDGPLRLSPACLCTCLSLSLSCNLR